MSLEKLFRSDRPAIAVRGVHLDLKGVPPTAERLGSLLKVFAAAEDARKAFAGLIEPIWIERYLAKRIEPLREELAVLAPRARQLDPAGYAAESQ